MCEIGDQEDYDVRPHECPPPPQLSFCLPSFSHTRPSLLLVLSPGCPRPSSPPHLLLCARNHAIPFSSVLVAHALQSVAPVCWLLRCWIRRRSARTMLHYHTVTLGLRGYSPAPAPDKLDSLMPEFVRDNAGKAFEFMVDTANEDRKAAGLCSVEEMFAGTVGSTTRHTDGRKNATCKARMRRQRTSQSTPILEPKSYIQCRSTIILLLSCCHCSCIMLYRCCMCGSGENLSAKGLCCGTVPCSKKTQPIYTQ